MEQQRQKTYYNRSKYGTEFDVGDLKMVFNPTIETGRTKKSKSFYEGPQVTREILNDLNFVIEDVKTNKINKTSATIDSKV